ncbi:hypothetical protein CP972_29045 [Streptomyces prasinus]|uniref:Uncharacterized protein n=1 Tax=Streptomyces prasinus TaxID=67345 RepID=A0ABX6B208_9ACTN|nr:hypothetical protein CP972_29045 [Streptomyces prasinus]
MREGTVKEHRAEPTRPSHAAERGPVDGAAVPAETRSVRIRSPRMLAARHAGPPCRKHGHPPQ